MSATKTAASPTNRAPAVDEGFVRAVQGLRGMAAERRPGPDDPLVPGSRLLVRQAREVFESEVLSRHLDLEARAMKARGEGFYTIGSSGHEANAALAAALRPSDPALLHYRSGPFFFQRATQRPGTTPLYDALLSLAASSEDPISGGRHKVWGSGPLGIIPQTSTIASHLPKALGLAVAIERRRHLKLDEGQARWPHDAVVVCSFGDASLNHATAQSALQSAGWLDHQTLRAPVLFVCEDNGIGISVPTPKGWVERSVSGRAGLHYAAADGSRLAEAFDACASAVDFVRRTRRPAFLHLAVERLMGHAGSDVETTYRTLEEIEAHEAKDPLIAHARQLIEAGAATADDLLALYEETRERVAAAAREAARRPRLTSVEEVTAPLAPQDDGAIEREALRTPDPDARARAWRGEALPEARRPRHLAMLLSWGLRDLLAKYPEMLVFGEDVAKKGGVYHVTADLMRTAGRARVFDTLLDETTILGMAMGAGLAGLLPCPEIQYLAYVHNALDQLRGEACSQSFFSGGRFLNPMVCRIASLGYQKGFGGHFHNDPSTTALRDIPGLAIACPSRGDDAVGMLRTAFALARTAGRVVAFLEPIALYMRKDIDEGDGAWQFDYPAPGTHHVPVGASRTYGAPGGGEADLAIVTYGNGVLLSLAAQRRLAEAGVRACVLDLRWLAPIDEAGVIAAVEAAGRRALVVCEGRRSGGVAEPVLALLAEALAADGLHARRVTGVDTYIPLGPAADLCLPSVEGIVSQASALVRGAAR